LFDLFLGACIAMPLSAGHDCQDYVALSNFSCIMCTFRSGMMNG